VGRYEPGLRTEASIVAATRELLVEEGLEGTTLKAICDRAGVRAGSFYNLFDSKEAVVLRVVGEAIAAVDPDPEGQRAESVSDLVEAYIAFITGEPLLARIYLQIAVAGSLGDGALGKRFLRHHDRRMSRFSEAMRRETPSLDRMEADARSEMLVATLNGLAFHLVLDPDFDFSAYARRAGRLRVRMD
jgi:AcrR family transcriptional regulator